MLLYCGLFQTGYVTSHMSESKEKQVSFATNGLETAVNYSQGVDIGCYLGLKMVTHKLICV